MSKTLIRQNRDARSTTATNSDTAPRSTKFWQRVVVTTHRRQTRSPYASRRCGPDGRSGRLVNIRHPRDVSAHALKRRVIVWFVPDVPLASVIAFVASRATAARQQRDWSVVVDEHAAAPRSDGTGGSPSGNRRCWFGRPCEGGHRRRRVHAHVGGQPPHLRRQHLIWRARKGSARHPHALGTSSARRTIRQRESWSARALDWASQEWLVAVKAFRVVHGSPLAQGGEAFVQFALDDRQPATILGRQAAMKSRPAEERGALGCQAAEATFEGRLVGRRIDRRVFGGHGRPADADRSDRNPPPVAEDSLVRVSGRRSGASR
jgi:hypothetical protein